MACENRPRKESQTCFALYREVFRLQLEREIILEDNYLTAQNVDRRACVLDGPKYTTTGFRGMCAPRGPEFSVFCDSQFSYRGDSRLCGKYSTSHGPSGAGTCQYRFPGRWVKYTMCLQRTCDSGISCRLAKAPPESQSECPAEAHACVTGNCILWREQKQAYDQCNVPVIPLTVWIPADCDLYTSLVACTGRPKRARLHDLRFLRTNRNGPCSTYKDPCREPYDTTRCFLR